MLKQYVYYNDVFIDIHSVRLELFFGEFFDKKFELLIWAVQKPIFPLQFNRSVAVKFREVILHHQKIMYPKIVIWS